MKNELIPSVNFHVWKACNMRCKFCFATFQNEKPIGINSANLSKDEALTVVAKLAQSGFEKITFAGGEPTLCPWLTDLIKLAKEYGLTTMIVSNGSGISELFLEQNRGCLDWIGLSIDSVVNKINLSVGRAVGGTSPMSRDEYLKLCIAIKSYGYGLKINTVVNRFNYLEDIQGFINEAKPQRWKIMQALEVKGQNDRFIESMEVNSCQFDYFISRNSQIDNRIKVVVETNDQIVGSYAMVDPLGRFFDNVTGAHRYSSPINEVGVINALSEMEYSLEKFKERGGLYDWSKKGTPSYNRITLSGQVASGKSTIGKLIAEKLGYEFKSLGNKIRSIADARGMSIAEFQRFCMLNPSEDREIDSLFSSECNNQTDLVIDYRLGYKFINQGFHVFLKISEDLALERLERAKRHNETPATLRERNDSFKTQFQCLYNTDYTDESNYDLVIEVDKYESAEDIADVILTEFKHWLSRR